MSILQKLIFNYWYFWNPPWDTNKTPPEVQEFIKTHHPGKALDLGCGTGTNAITLAQSGWQVLGVDFVGKAIRTARRKAQQARVKVDFRVDDVTKLSGIIDAFDFILDIGCYHNLDSKGMKAYRSNINRLLKNDGTFLLYAFFRDKLGNGLVSEDLDAFSPPLVLISRVDGWERGSCASVWLTFQRDERKRQNA